MSRPLESATGAVVYRGPSRLDGSPVVVVVTGIRRTSDNAKTGAMAQSWIIRSDEHPVQAVHSGADQSICGDCPLRPLNARETGGPMCYVNKGFGPAAVFRGLSRGIYPDASPAVVRDLLEVRGIPARFGSYGDPAAVPTRVWSQLQTSRRHTGYSHQWRRRASLRGLVMASADSLADAETAWADGWRTFRVVRSLDEVQPREIICPASAEGGRKTTCDRCGLCNGSRGLTDGRKSIAIVDHGPTAPRAPKTVTNLTGSVKQMADTGRRACADGSRRHPSRDGLTAAPRGAAG